MGAGEGQNQIYLRAVPDKTTTLTAGENLPKLAIISVNKISHDISQLKIRHLAK